MKSIKLYLVTAILSTITLLSFLAGLHGYRSSVEAADKLFDKQLAETARFIDLFTEQKDNNRFVEEQLVFQFWSADQQKLLQTSGPLPAISDFEPGFGYKNFGGHRWRTYTKFNSQLRRWLLVAERADKRFVLAEVIALESLTPIVISLPVAAVMIWLIIGSGLSVLSRLAADLADKKADDLACVTYDRIPFELVPVIASINALFARLENAFEREKRFAADAAHELRTPISALKVHVHNLKHELVQHGSKIAVVDDDVLRLEHLVEQILSLYQTTPAHFRGRMEKVDMCEIAQRTIIELYAEFEKKSQTIALMGEATYLNGDPHTLQIMLFNLLSNANKYSPPETDIEVAIRQTENSISVTVVDCGPGIPESDYQRVFDRFYRVGGDRHSSSVAGCGLGLSIVKHIVELHNAKINLSSAAGHKGLQVTIDFPKLGEL